MIFNDKDQKLYALCDYAARIAIGTFTIAHTLILTEYLMRLPIERFDEGFKVEHILELFDRCKKKHKDPLQRTLAKADRLFFGINDRRERDERQAVSIYEELSNDLPEARSMCLVVYHSEYCSIDDLKSPEARACLKKINEITTGQLLSQRYSPVGLYCVRYVASMSCLSSFIRTKIQSARKLQQKVFPLPAKIDRPGRIVSCNRDRCNQCLYEEYAVKCEFFKTTFCSVNCQMTRFIVECINFRLNFNLEESSIRSLAKDLGPVDYLDVNDPSRLIEYFNVKSLCLNHQAFLKQSLQEKSFIKCAILLREPLGEYIESPNEPPLDTPIRSLWCLAALLLSQFRSHPGSNYIDMVFAICVFLLQSGVLANLGESKAKEATDHISTILSLATVAHDTIPKNEAFFFC